MSEDVVPARRVFEALVDLKVLPPMSWTALDSAVVRSFEEAIEALGGDPHDILDEVEALADASAFVSSAELREIIKYHRARAEASGIEG